MQNSLNLNLGWNFCSSSGEAMLTIGLSNFKLPLIFSISTTMMTDDDTTTQLRHIYLSPVQDNEA